MGRVDEGVDEFFSKKVTKINSRSGLNSLWTTCSDDLTQLSTSMMLTLCASPFLLPLRRFLRSSDSQDGEKKKSKGGFLNLIKRSSKSDKSDKSDKSEKNQAAPTSSGSSSASAASPLTHIIPEEPSSPKTAAKSPAPEPRSRWTLAFWIWFCFEAPASQSVPVLLQRCLQPLAGHRLQQQLRPLRGAEDAGLHGWAVGELWRQGESTGREAVHWSADDGQRPPGRDEGQTGAESSQGEGMSTKP